ncbi:MAG: hypothetical protein PHG85_07115 [Candidatus Altiarchaeota archaeon]|nr:hypothetical protein [Candidatus Altiarchaeota archaeon]
MNLLSDIKAAVRYVFSRKGLLSLALVNMFFSFFIGGFIAVDTGESETRICAALILIPFLLLSLLADELVSLVVLCRVKSDESSTPFSMGWKYLGRYIAQTMLLSVAFVAAVVSSVLLSVVIASFSKLLAVFFISPVFCAIFYLSIRLALGPSIIVLADMGVMESLSESWRVTRGRMMYLAGAAIILALVSSVISISDSALTLVFKALGILILKKLFINPAAGFLTGLLSIIFTVFLARFYLQAAAAEKAGGKAAK